MDDLKRESVEGIEAKQLLESTAFNRAFEMLETGVISKLRRVGVNDDATRNQLVLTLQLLDALKSALQQTIETGKMADITIEKPTMLRRMFG